LAPALTTGTLRPVDGVTVLRLLWFLRRSSTTSAADSPALLTGRVLKPPTFIGEYAVVASFRPLLYAHKVLPAPSPPPVCLFLRKQTRFASRLFVPLYQLASTQGLTPSPSFDGVLRIRALQTEVSLRSHCWLQVSGLGSQWGGVFSRISIGLQTDIIPMPACRIRLMCVEVHPCSHRRLLTYASWRAVHVRKKGLPPLFGRC